MRSALVSWSHPTSSNPIPSHPIPSQSISQCANDEDEITSWDDEEDARLGDSLLSLDVLTGGAKGIVVETVAGRKGRTPRPGLGDGDGAEAMFREPTGIAVDSRGRAVVVDAGNGALRALVYGGDRWHVEGVFDAERNCVAPGGGGGGGEVEERGEEDDKEITTSVFDASFTEVGAEQHRLRIAATAASGAIAWIGIGQDKRQEPTSPRVKRVDALRSSFLLADASGVFHLVLFWRGTRADALVEAVAGMAAGGGYADGAYRDALFRAPRAIAVEGGAGGRVMVADTGNNVVRGVGP